MNHEEKLDDLQKLGASHEKVATIDSYFFKKTGFLPNTIRFDRLLRKKIDKLIGEDFKEIYIDRYMSYNYEYVDKWYVYKETDILLRLMGSSDTMEGHICYRENREEANKLASMISKTEKKAQASCINLITYNERNFELMGIKLPKVRVDLELSYGSGFTDKHKCIVEAIKSEQSGVILLHSCPGMGKSSYIQYLCNKIRQKFIFLPSSMSEMMASPSFIGFLRRECKNSIIVIEDAENVLKSRELTQNGAISDILNISDGLLGKALNIKIIATYNTSRAQIDEALMRKGRLLCEHEFEPLSLEDSRKLFEHLYPGEDNSNLTDRMTLADIYNYNTENFRKEGKRMVVGFKK